MTRVRRQQSDRRGSRRRSGSTFSRPTLLANVLWLILASSAAAATQPQAALGNVDFPISCSAPAQVEFNRAIALLHHMTYPQAREAFRKVAALDPACAMAHWGVAITLFQPLWPTRPSPADLVRGWESVQRAKSLKPPTERERLFLATGEAFFRDPESSDYWLRIRRWEEASAKVHAAFPDDAEAAVFYALAHLATGSADGGVGAASGKAAAILLRVYERHPGHPGAMHYLVHANDTPGRERESLDVTRKYDAVAPRNPHALHMPTHIYVRLGEWPAVASNNRQAAAAALEHPAGERGELVWDEFAHAIEYLVYADLQMGEDEDAARQIQRLRATTNLEPSFKTAFHFASTEARYALERRAWDEAARITPRMPATLAWDRFAWAEAIAWFARGLGSLHNGTIDDARSAAARLATLESSTRKGGEDVFARHIQVLQLGLNAWLAHADGREPAALALMREAAALEEATPKHPVTPGPTLPAQEMLGDLLMAQKQHAGALAAYRQSLSSYPGRFNSLLGAARAARALGDDTAARGYYQDLLERAGKGSRQPALTEAAEFVKTRQPRGDSTRIDATALVARDRVRP